MFCPSGDEGLFQLRPPRMPGPTTAWDSSAKALVAHFCTPEPSGCLWTPPPVRAPAGWVRGEQAK